MQKDTPPVVPFGPTSQIGLAVTALLALIAAGTAIAKGDHSEETLTAAAGALVTLLTVLAGRYGQAVKATSPQPTPQGNPPVPAIVNVAGAPQDPRTVAERIAAQLGADDVADDEPGDEDGLAGMAVTKGEHIPADEGDGGPA